MSKGQLSKENIKKMVDIFYAKIIKNEKIGPFFISKLGDDLKSETWQVHLELLTNFWSSMMLQDGTYRGNPFAPHLNLGELKEEHFSEWLMLFFQTLDQVFDQSVANTFKERSEMIANNFMRNLSVAQLLR